MGVSAGGSGDPLESVVVELRRIAAELLGDVSSYADDMLAFILEPIPEAGSISPGFAHESGLVHLAGLTTPVVLDG